MCIRDRVHGVDAFHDFGFLGDDYRLSIFSLFVTQQFLEHEDGLAVLEVFSVTPCDVLADALGFGLGEACIYDEVQFAVAFQRIDVLFLKEYPDSSGSQQADVVQTVHRVSGETGDGFRYDIVDLSGEAGLDHVIELRALICACSRDTFVSVQAGEFPFGVPGDQDVYKRQDIICVADKKRFALKCRANLPKGKEEDTWLKQS